MGTIFSSSRRQLRILRITGRVEALCSRLGEEFALDTLLVFSPENIRWLIGFTGSAGTLVVRPDEIVLVTDGRYIEQARAEAKSSGVEIVVREARSNSDHLDVLANVLSTGSACGFDPAEVTVENFEIYSRAFATKLVPVSGLVVQLRRIKSDAEVARIEAAAAAADRALADVEPMLTDGVTERDIRDELEYLMRRHGADGPSYETIVATGVHGARPHHRPTFGRISKGDAVLIDVGALVDGYHSDMTRTYLIGDVDPVLADMHQVVCEAQQLGLSMIAPGVLCSDVDQVCRQYITERGYGPEFVHGTGHGVGLQIHELPWLRKDFSEPLQAGEVVTVEPGVYRGGLGGVRIEDLVLVTPIGHRVLTQSQKDHLCLQSPRTT
ncbi:MAG: M24 family metallopeptidase [Ilumatobacteraceae bacterium]